MPVPTNLVVSGFAPSSLDAEVFTNASRAALGGLGTRVTRATDTLPQDAPGTEALFTVSGLVLLTHLYGIVTVAIQNQANNTKLTLNHATGTDVDLCANASIANKPVNTIFTITGTVADAMLCTGIVQRGPSLALILPSGTIDLTCAAANTGEVRWVLHYLPLEDGATVTATAV